MKNKYFVPSMILSMFLLIILGGMAYGAVGVGSWVSNKGQSLSINDGQGAEFRYGVTAITEMGGKYSIKLYREGTSAPIHTYINDQPVLNNGVQGGFNVTPSDYSSITGNYYIMIYSVDTVEGTPIEDYYPLYLTVSPVSNPLTVSCTATPASGTAPLDVTFKATASGGSGTYNYAWNFGDGSTDSSYTSTFMHEYGTGTFSPYVKVTDSNGGSAQAICGASGITVNKPALDVQNINCFPRVIDGGNQSCSVTVRTTSGRTAVNANVNIYYDDGAFFGSCITNSISGACTAMSTVHGVGTYTVYATASSDGYISDTDKSPTYTFDVFKQRYNVINLATYNDSNYFYPDSVFYRGEALYAKFQVYDPVNNRFVGSDVVTSTSLVSLAGGRIDLSRVRYYNNWYYYRLSAIPLTHTFIGDSNVFAFAFNFTDVSGGEAQVDLTILNNKPTITNIPDVYVDVGQSVYIDLDNHGRDLEDPTLEWHVISNEAAAFTSDIGAGNVLSITGNNKGNGFMTLRAYDLDGDYADTTFNVNVLEHGIMNDTLMATCEPDRISGAAPLTVNFQSTASGGKGPYVYSYNFDDGTLIAGPSSTRTNTYSNQGTYNPKMMVIDSNGHTSTTTCGTIIVAKHDDNTPINVTCTANPTSGTTPFNVVFNADARGGSGAYTNYTWEYGDGAEQTVYTSSVMHTFTKPGYFNGIRLTVMDSNGKTGSAICDTVNATTTHSATINVTCTSTPTSGTAPLDVIFYGVATGGSGTYTSYNWVYGDCAANTVPIATVRHTFTKEGYYNNIQLTVTDSDGKTGSAICQTVNVTALPTIPLSVTCTAYPTSGTTPLEVTFSSTATGGTGIYTYNWYPTGSGVPVTSITNQLVATYSRPGVYNPYVSVTDSKGTTVNAFCGLIVVNNRINDTNVTISFDMGGPYTGYINEPVTFDASRSTGSIVKYSWDFGDGTGTDTSTATIQHTYNMVNRYTVRLTIQYANGAVRTGTTTATIIEHTNAPSQPAEETQDGNLIIEHLLISGGDAGEIFAPDDELTATVGVKSEFTGKLKDAHVTISIPELGIQSSSTSFDLNHGGTHSETVTLPLYDVKPGVYYLKISVGNTDAKRIKYREIEVKK